MRPVWDAQHDRAFDREGRLDFPCRAFLHLRSIPSGSIFAATKLALSRRFLTTRRPTRSKRNAAALEPMRLTAERFETVWLTKH